MGLRPGDGHLRRTHEKTGALKRLTTARGYDAEGSYSPDGQWIVFSSMRDAYNRPLNDAGEEALDENPSYFAEIYIMTRRRLGPEAADRTSPGYDGGPFFTHDGTQIRLAPLRRAGPDRRRVDDEAGRHRSEADHELRRP